MAKKRQKKGTIISILLAFLIGSYLIGCTRKLETRYDNGQLKEKYEVRKDNEGNYIKHGSYVSWYEEGQKKQEGFYKNNKKNGNHIFWYENGTKES